jgi:ectoine hydroxylase-related dioxygenase (phytanoyl-CoA dioxygenase family)
MAARFAADVGVLGGEDAPMAASVAANGDTGIGEAGGLARGSAGGVGLGSSGSGIDSIETSASAGRGDKRVELKLSLRAPYTNSSLIASPLLLPFVKMALSDAAEVDTFSAVASLPGAKAGAWHADANALFFGKVGGVSGQGGGGGGGGGSSGGGGLPAHGLVAVVPLVGIRSHHDVDTNGPTEFVTGSHLLPSGEQAGYWKRKARQQHEAEHAHERQQQQIPRHEEQGSPPARLEAQFYAFPTPILRPAAEVGDVVLFDLRLRHRGGANRGDETRPIIYLSYVESWWKDSLNFKAKQSAEWASLPSAAMRKLFIRLDAERYVQRLEEFVSTNHGADALYDLQDHTDYKQAELRI